ncbi:MAG TPA: hypothetical protein VMX54_21825 [Vicinamibacteria bacterium]|nr:hypothetical protein [Vicinamibacteria bacterium]
MTETPFDSLEGAFDYVSLLLEAVRETRGHVAEDLQQAGAAGAVREAEALQLVAWKLERLESHLASGRHLLNDLRRLRRVLVGDASDVLEEKADPTGKPGDLH